MYIKALRPLWWNCEWRRQSHQAICTCNLGVVCNSYATQTVISHSGYNSSTVVTMSRENSGEIIFTRIRVNVYVYGFHARLNAGIENRHFRTWSRARFSKVSVINGPGKSLLSFQINVSIVFRITQWNYWLTKQNKIACKLGSAPFYLFDLNIWFWTRDFRETGPSSRKRNFFINFLQSTS